MNILYKDNNVYIRDLDELNIRTTFDCGQCFRWNEIEKKFDGVAFGKHIKILQKSNREIVIYNSNQKDFESLWRNYLDLDTNYKKIKENLSSIHPNLKKACDFSTGIRILKQDPWETLCSFIVSQNNNIPRIKKIISSLCLNFGNQIDQSNYEFPDYMRLSKLNEKELSVIRAGFRTKYILDAARKVENGNIIIDDIKNMPIEKARTELMKIVGVGPKVAECTLLYGFNRLEAFPVDVWMKRAMSVLFPDIDKEEFGKYRGVAQQYIFYYSRMNPELFNQK